MRMTWTLVACPIIGLAVACGSFATSCGRRPNPVSIVGSGRADDSSGNARAGHDIRRNSDRPRHS